MLGCQCVVDDEVHHTCTSKDGIQFLDQKVPSVGCTSLMWSDSHGWKVWSNVHAAEIC